MNSEKANKDKWIHVRVKAAEYNELVMKWKKTTCRHFSIYVRDILLNRKITSYTRNKSLDEFMAELVLLRKELNSIGNNFNQAVRKLNACQFVNDLQVLGCECIVLQQALVAGVEEIQAKMNRFFDKWSQE